MARYKNTELYKEERRWLIFAVTCVLLSASCYTYFLCASVAHVVMRKEINQEIVALGSSIGELESQYINAQHKVSADIASMHGYIFTSAKIFIEPVEPTVALSKNNES